MNKQEIYNYLKTKNVWHEITEHQAVYNMAELSQTYTKDVFDKERFEKLREITIK